MLVPLPVAEEVWSSGETGLIPDHSEMCNSRASAPPVGVMVTVFGPPLALATYQMYAVTSCDGSLTGPRAETKLSPAVSEIVRVLRGRAAVPVMIKKSPAVLADGKATESFARLDSEPLVASWISRMAESDVALAWLDGWLT